MVSASPSSSLRDGCPIQPLLLIDASGLAREALAVIRAREVYDVIGFLDDDPSLARTNIEGVPVLGPIAVAAAHGSAQFLVCAGRGSAREGIVSRLAALGVCPSRYATIVHKSVEAPEGCVMGAGSIVLAGVVMTTAVTLGEHVVVMPNATLTHDCALEDYATVCAGVALGGTVVIGRGAYIGMNASVRERTVVGGGATLAMGAVLLHDLPAGETWAGAPARRMSARDE